MPIGDIIGGARQRSGASSGGDSEPASISQVADSAGETIRYYLNSRTPAGVEWKLNFAFIATVLSAASAFFSLYGALT